jgi:signal peptidase I
LTIATLERVWKNEYLQTVIMIIIIVGAVFGFWYGTQLVLSTPYPALAVASGSMSILPRPSSDGWFHPFERTLQIGDLIILRGAKPADIQTGPPPVGDIIVFHSPGSSDELIVHRAIENATGPDGKIYFRTKGDGNSIADYYEGNGTLNGMVSQDFVVGKVILRIPWLGHFTLFLRESSGMFIIVSIMIILIILELVIPSSKRSEAETVPNDDLQKEFEA